MSTSTSDNALYEEALNQLHSQISTTPSSILASSKKRKSTIEEMRRYLRALSFSKQCFAPLVHITGSKGKGSTASFTEGILREIYGLNTGLFTSPHLIRVNERIRLNGRPVSDAVFAEGYMAVKRMLSDGCEDLPTYFRMLTLVALFIFRNYRFENGRGVDVVILEVGMGGRYDATNLFRKGGPFVCGVTLIDYDHQWVLGDTLEQIAWEKGGIFQHSRLDGNYPHFFSIAQKDSVLDVLRSCTTECTDHTSKPNLYVVGHHEDDILPATFRLGIPGAHQRTNAQLAYAMCKSLIHQIHPTINAVDPTLETLEQTLWKVRWPGRCQTLSPRGHPNIHFHVDGAHTEQSMRATVTWFARVCGDNRILIFNCSHERNPVPLLQLLTEMNFESVYFCHADEERPSMVDKPSATQLLKEHGIAHNETSDNTWQDTLAAIWKALQSPSEVFVNMSAQRAMDLLVEKNSQREVHVCVTGSLYIVGSVLKTCRWEEESASGRLV